MTERDITYLTGLMHQASDLVEKLRTLTICYPGDPETPANALDVFAQLGEKLIEGQELVEKSRYDVGELKAQG